MNYKFNAFWSILYFLIPFFGLLIFVFNSIAKNANVLLQKHDKNELFYLIRIFLSHLKVENDFISIFLITKSIKN